MMIIAIDVSYNPENCGWAVFTERLRYCGKFKREMPNIDKLTSLHRQVLMLMQDMENEGLVINNTVYLAIDYPLMFPYKEKEQRAGPRANLNDLAKNHQALGVIRSALRLPPSQILLYFSSEHSDDKKTTKSIMLAKYPALKPNTPHHITDAIKIGEWAQMQLKLPAEVRSSLENYETKKKETPPRVKKEQSKQNQ